MKTHITKHTSINLSHKRGAALTIAVLFFVLISIAIVMGSINPVINDFKSGNELINSKLSYFTAEAGNEDAIYRTKKGKQMSSPEVTVLNGGTVSATVVDISSSDKEVTSNSTVYSLARNVKTVLNTGVGSDFVYGAQVGEGGLVMSNGSSVQGTGGAVGNVYSNGPISGSGSANITGSATVATSVLLDSNQSNVCNQDNIVGQTNPQIDFAQSFVPTQSKPIYKVSLYIKKVGSSNPPTAYVKIVADNAGSPATSALASATLPVALVTATYGWVDITFSSPYTVTAGQKYWLLIDAGQNSTRYWVWCGDSNNGSGNGLGKYKQIWSTSGTWTQITGDLNIKTYLGAGPGTINSVAVAGNAYANTVTNSTITGSLYCQTGSGNNKSCNTGLADPVPLNMPLSQGNIDQWITDATAGGTITGNCPGAAGCSTVLGPKKINGNLTLTNSASLTLTGVVHVTGTVNISNNGEVKCDVSFGTDSCVLVTDGSIDVSNNGKVNGSGQVGSYALLVSLITGCNGSGGSGCASGSSGINLGNNLTGGIFYTTASMINISNNAEIKSVVGYKLQLSNNAVIKYEQGVANTNFSSGPGGGWNVKSWSEVQ